MTPEEKQFVQHRRLGLLIPLMIVSNALVLLCMLGLGAMMISGWVGFRVAGPGGDDNARVVLSYLDETMPSYKYRVREWYPATPLTGNLINAGATAEEAAERGCAQRVRLVFYGPNGARELDTVYWIQNGKVTRVLPSQHAPSTREL